MKPLDWSTLSKNFTPRDRQAHKGMFGHVLVIGGDYGMPGSVRMAAEAALRVGAGLVSVATRPTHIAVVSGPRPEVMCYGISDTSELFPLLEKATVIICGPGLGKSEWSKTLFLATCNTKLPMVIDADALGFLAKNPVKKDRWIITPHPGEAGKLLGIEASAVQKDRASTLQKITQRYGGVAVLKGAGTLIQAEDEEVYLCTAGNTGMATAGMGDVLSGVIGGLLAQRFSLLTAATLGVVLHATAADNITKKTGERGLLAMDLMPELQRLINPTSNYSAPL